MKPIIMLMILLSVFIVACAKAPIGTPLGGSLSGHIDIGPICPVERNPPDPNCQPTAATYAAWPIAVYDSSTNNIIEKIVPDDNGDYLVNLPVGNYVVDLENAQTIGRSDLPKYISIYTNGRIYLNISIDTGIR